MKDRNDRTQKESRERKGWAKRVTGEDVAEETVKIKRDEQGDRIQRDHARKSAYQNKREEKAM